MAFDAITTRGRTILVSSDDGVIFERAAKVLEAATFSVVRTSALELREELVRRTRDDICLVIVDARFAAEKKSIRMVSRRDADLPVLAIGEAARMSEVRDAGARSFLTLPLTDDLLLFEVARLTGQELHG